MHGTRLEHRTRSSDSTAHGPAPRRVALLPLAPDHLLALVDPPAVGEPAVGAPDRFQARFGYPLADGLAEMFASGDVSPAWLARLRAATATDPWEHGFAVLHRDHARVIGTIGFKGPPDADGAVEIAYGVAPAYQGQGYATEAARALLAFAFADGRVHRVLATTRPHDGPSPGVLRKCGFTLLGTVDDPEDGPVWQWECRPPMTTTTEVTAPVAAGAAPERVHAVSLLRTVVHFAWGLAVTLWVARRVRALCCCLTLLCASAANAQVATPVASSGGAAAEEQAIRAVLARFYDAWNAHDADKMVAAYADDVDHINVFGEWHKGKAAIRQDLLRFHAGPGRNSQKTYAVEKIRFVRPDVAVVHVRSLSAVGNLGTYVLAKQAGEWRTVGFTNVEYQLPPAAPRTGLAETHGGPGGAHVASTTIPVPGRCEEPRTGPPDAVGCHLMGDEPVGTAPATPLFWHIDAFPTRAAAEAARRGRGTVAEAHGRVWLVAVAGADWRPEGGSRVARVGPLPVTAGRAYTAHFFEGVAPAAARTPVHRHAGPEAWFVLEGTPCLQTPEGARVMRPGESFVVPEGPPMLLTGSGTAMRRTLGLVLHDAAKPWSIPAAEDWTPTGSCGR